MQLDGRVKYGGVAPPKAFSFVTNLVIVMWRKWGKNQANIQPHRRTCALFINWEVIDIQLSLR